MERERKLGDAGLAGAQVAIRPYDAFLSDLAALNASAAASTDAGGVRMVVPRACPLAVAAVLPAVRLDEAPSLVAAAKGTSPARPNTTASPLSRSGTA
jgi:hypothetical protein